MTSIEEGLTLLGLDLYLDLFQCAGQGLAKPSLG